MSRIGKHPIDIPDGVEVAVAGQTVTVKGGRGALSRALPDEVEVVRDDRGVWVRPRDSERRARAMWGLSRTLIANMIEGVTKGYEKRLEIQGVGYTAKLKGKELELALGFSHPVSMTPPEGIEFEVPQQREIVVRGIDKQLVGETAARIRRIRPPEPYKGKGVRYAGEQVRRKEGKKK